MHWPSYDKTTWGLVLAIGAIVLTFPLSVVANWVTPTLRNWWAERSVAALKDRIAMLETELTEMNKRTPLSLEDLLLLQAVQTVGICIVTIMLCLAAVGVCLSQSLPRNLRLLSFVFSLIASSAGGYAIATVTEHFTTILGRRSLIHKREVAANINKLSAKLQSFDKRTQ